MENLINALIRQASEEVTHNVNLKEETVRHYIRPAEKYICIIDSKLNTVLPTDAEVSEEVYNFILSHGNLVFNPDKALDTKYIGTIEKLKEYVIEEERTPLEYSPTVLPPNYEDLKSICLVVEQIGENLSKLQDQFKKFKEEKGEK